MRFNHCYWALRWIQNDSTPSFFLSSSISFRAKDSTAELFVLRAHNSIQFYLFFWLLCALPLRPRFPNSYHSNAIFIRLLSNVDCCCQPLRLNIVTNAPWTMNFALTKKKWQFHLKFFLQFFFAVACLFASFSKHLDGLDESLTNIVQWRRWTTKFKMLQQGQRVTETKLQQSYGYLIKNVRWHWIETPTMFFILLRIILITPPDLNVQWQ